MIRIPWRCTAVILVSALSACAARQPSCQAPIAGADVVYVEAHGWHVEVGLLADRLQGKLTMLRDMFPGAKAFMFGYGKRTFMTAPTDNLGQYLLGPVPGDAVIQVTGLSVMPPEAYQPGEMMQLSLPRGGAAALSNFIWADLGKDTSGAARLIGRGNYPGSLFYAANSGYSLFHTCNTWAVDALAAAGLPVLSAGVVLSHQAMDRAGTALAEQCRQAGAG